MIRIIFWIYGKSPKKGKTRNILYFLFIIARPFYTGPTFFFSVSASGSASGSAIATVSGSATADGVAATASVHGAANGGNRHRCRRRGMGRSRRRHVADRRRCRSPHGLHGIPRHRCRTSCRASSSRARRRHIAVASLGGWSERKELGWKAKAQKKHVSR